MSRDAHNTLSTTQWSEFVKNVEGYCVKGMFGLKVRQRNTGGTEKSITSLN